MLNIKRNIVVGACLAGVACAGSAQAQETTQGNTVVGPPQLRDFRLPGERRAAPAQPPAQEPIIQQQQPQQRPATPQPVAPRPAPTEQRQTPPPAAAQPARPPVRQPGARPTAEPPRTRTEAPAPVDTAPAAPAPAPAPQSNLPYTLPDASPAPAPLPAPQATPAPATPSAPENGYPFWLYLLPVGLALLAVFTWRRRRASRVVEPEYVAEPVAAPPPRPERPMPKPRPWIELEFKPERATAALTESSVQFELVVRNTGGSAARNIRIEARMFNAGREQDKEIGAFFRRPASEMTTSTLPSLEAESETSFRSVVTMPREAMRAVQVQGRSLFVPMVAFNIYYEWGTSRTGQTSRSYVVGREPDQPAERMAAFRLDLGPRIYRTVGQREHSLARRV